MESVMELAMESADNEFRAVERKIRKMIMQSKSQGKNSKRRVPGMKKADAGMFFDASEIIDYRVKNSRIKETIVLGTNGTNGTNGTEGSDGIDGIEGKKGGKECVRIIEIEGMPKGFYIIAGAISISEQLSLSKTALEEYSRAEHTNLSNLSKLSKEKQEEKDDTVLSSADPSIPNIPTGEHSVPVEESLSYTDHSVSTEESEELILTEVSSIAVEEYSIPSLPNDIWSLSIEDNNNFERFKMLRWASLGYHYDWTKRMYQENVKSQFPVNLGVLCKYLAGLVGEKMEAEAAIVNFYPMGTYMSGHLDDAEHAMEEPIVSISLGCPAIFLLGGKTKDVKPTGILIRSGDVIIMSSESRYAYHGVPGVVAHDFLNKLKKKSIYDLDSEVQERNNIVPHNNNINNNNDSNNCNNMQNNDVTGCNNISAVVDNHTAITTDPIRNTFCCDFCQLIRSKNIAECSRDRKECSASSNIPCPFDCGYLPGIEDINKNQINSDEINAEEVNNSDINNSELIKSEIRDPVLKYLMQGRININVRRVARPNAEWVDKQGSGAAYNAS